MSIAANQSKPFKLAQWKDYVIPEENDRKWRCPEYSSATNEQYEKVVNKWVYVYQRKGPAAFLLMEIFVNAQGTMGVLGAEEVANIPDPLDRPAADKLHQVPTLTLEHTINGKDVYHYFYISRIRVAAKILMAPSSLETKTAELLPEVNLQDLTNFVQIDGQDYVIGLDPIVVGLARQDKYEEARDRYLTYTIPSSDNPDKGCEARLLKKLLQRPWLA